MDEVLSATLRDAVNERLLYLDKLAREADLSSRAALAETEIGNLTAIVREVLNLHQPDHDGRCPQCRLWRRRRKFPCPVWTIVHRHLLATITSRLVQAGRHAAVRTRTTPLTAS